MKFENTEVWGFKHAIRGMRNPLESWDKSDSLFKSSIQCFSVLGENDLNLMQKLIKAGPEHRKFMRQIFVSVDTTAPLYWWKEFDTYKVGTVANSTSTMHKLASTPITLDCFETDNVEVLEELNYEVSCWWGELINWLEKLRQLHNKNMELSKASNITDQERKRLITMAKRYWKELIRLLPESWLQTRTVTMNFENILSMIHQRKGHKLTEWSKDFIEWAESLPYAKELLFYKGE
jgi:hypothetical protein